MNWFAVGAIMTTILDFVSVFLYGALFFPLVVTVSCLCYKHILSHGTCQIHVFACVREIENDSYFSTG